MKSIDSLVNEHNHILVLLDCIEKMVLRIYEKSEVPFLDFKMAIQLVRDYADSLHHGKEEEILFKKMMEELGAISIQLIQQGMMVEHDLGRFHIAELEKALLLEEKSSTSTNQIKIITEAMSYVFLLRRHIEKENTIVYPFAQKHLVSISKDKIERISKQYDEEKKEQIQKNLFLLNQLQERYLV